MQSGRCRRSPRYRRRQLVDMGAEVCVHAHLRGTVEEDRDRFPAEGEESLRALHQTVLAVELSRSWLELKKMWNRVRSLCSAKATSRSRSNPPGDLVNLSGRVHGGANAQTSPASR